MGQRGKLKKQKLLTFIKSGIYFFELIWLIYILCTQIGWIYGSVTEDILTGFKMHARGWISIYCMPPRPAFKGSAPINLSDRLNQVLRWALGSIEILLSRHCPIWYAYNGRLKVLERLAYINTIVYPLTSLPLLAYCILPAICLLTGKFIIPEVGNSFFSAFIEMFFLSLNLLHLMLFIFASGSFIGIFRKIVFLVYVLKQLQKGFYKFK